MNDHDRKERYLATRRVTIIGGVLDLVLGIIKIMAGYAAASHALIADGVHSMSDLVTDVLVVWAAREASRGPDENHPYGHQRIETLATIILGLALATVALAIAWDATESALGRATPSPGLAAILVAAFSIFSKEAIFRYTMSIANRLDSELLRSNAWHSRSDALSSVVVIIGVAGAIVGYVYLDAVAAVVVAAMILWVSGKMIWQGASELVDTGVHPVKLKRIQHAVHDAEGVRDVHDLRTRRMGSEIFLDGHVLVDPRISVSEGHRVAEAVRQRLRHRFPDITDITIHIDAEDDEAYQLSSHLPLRKEVDAMLAGYWTHIPESELIRQKTFHYLNGKLHVEICLPLDAFPDIESARNAADKLRQAVGGDPRFAEIQVVFG